MRPKTSFVDNSNIPADPALPVPELRLLACDLALIDRWWETAPCCNPHWRLYWNPVAGATVSHADASIPLVPETIVLVAPETSFARACRVPREHLYVHFTVGRPFSHVPPGVHALPVGPDTRRRLRRLLQLQRAGATSPERPLLALGLVCHALASLPADLARESVTDPRLARVLTAMQTNVSQPLANPALARLAGMAETSFIRLFRDTIGESPQTHYLRRRLEQAALELHYTDLKLDTVAERHGFCDRYHFSRAFRRVRGETPAAYRRRARAEERGRLSSATPLSPARETPPSP